MEMSIRLQKPVMVLWTVLMIYFLLSAVVGSPVNLRGKSDDVDLPRNLGWAKDWMAMHVTGGAESPRRSLRTQLAKSLGVKFCEESPDGPLQRNNLAMAFSDLPLNGWKGARLASMSGDSGISIVKASSLKDRMDGPELKFVDLQKGDYKVTGWARMESNSSKHSFFRATVKIPGQAVSQGHIIATGVVKNECWTKIQGGFKVDGTKTVSLKVGGLPPRANVYLASFAVQSVDTDQYRQQQNERISQLRKRDVNLKVITSTGSPAEAYVELDQTVSDFPFGAATAGSILVSEDYQRWFRKRFSWSVLENEAKWYYQERWKGDKNYGDADKMVDLFRRMNISVRGHAVLWDVPTYQQQWLKDLNKEDLAKAVDNRVDTVVKRYKGKYKHWDVLNEMLHGSFYEERLENKNFAGGLFRKVKNLDPNVKLFLNDYNVVEYYNDQEATPETYLEDAANIEANGGVVDALGVQGHFRDADGPRIKSELDALATGGYPIWFTELDIYESDPEKQADKLEVVMREAFSHPAVEGILQWEVARPNCNTTKWKYIDPSKCTTPCTTCLTDGNFNDRPIGKRYVRLRKEWSTHRNRWLRKGGLLSFRGFFGKYRLRVRYGKNLHYEKNFWVPKGSSTFNITVVLPSSTKKTN